MPGLLVHSAAIMTCPHGGKVSFLPSGPPGALVQGTPVITAADQLLITGCGNTPVCTKVQWVNMAQVLVNGSPALVQTTPSGPGNGICVGSPPLPPNVLSMQAFVTAV